MCGIFGIIDKEAKKSGKAFRALFLLSESRGKEASGFALKKKNEIRVFKTPLPASAMVKKDIFKREALNQLQNASEPFIAIGHSRLVTNGYEQFDTNNQPVVKNGLVVIHNGIIVNQNDLWNKYNDEDRLSELDSELIPTIVDHEVKDGKGLEVAFGILFNEIYGMTNIAVLSNFYNNLFLATNNGSLYYIYDLNTGSFAFASEKHILNQFLHKQTKIDKEISILQLMPGEFISYDLNSYSYCKIKLGEKIGNLQINSEACAINVIKDEIHKKSFLNSSLEISFKNVNTEIIKEYENRKHLVDSLKRCSKCILPETFPYIEFDEDGVCNYCNNYNKITYHGKDSLLNVTNQYRKKNGEPECLMPFSGGRDSSYALHYAVKELGLKPIAFSYDWGMITDLARRNQARMCGKLGVEHILVSADIRKKRNNIHKNVTAWLKKPDLGTIPLFMAGDKQYFYYANQLLKQNSLSLSILGENFLETTNFKTGFCGIPPSFHKGHTYSLSLLNKIKMLMYYGMQYFKNPAYFNASVFDTLDAFKSYYVIEHNNLNIFNYIRWDEKLIKEVLIKEYDWETDPGTQSTWRIGDGTAAFYNYIYYMVAGFSENDTFRSNQIREGDLTRNEALEFSEKENAPRWSSLQWYCRTIDIDFEKAIRRINSINYLYND